MEINITDKAKEELKNMLQGQSGKKIRVAMTGIS